MIEIMNRIRPIACECENGTERYCINDIHKTIHDDMIKNNIKRIKQHKDGNKECTNGNECGSKGNESGN